MEGELLTLSDLEDCKRLLNIGEKTESTSATIELCTKPSQSDQDVVEALLALSNSSQLLFGSYCDGDSKKNQSTNTADITIEQSEAGLSTTMNETLPDSDTDEICKSGFSKSGLKDDEILPESDTDIKIEELCYDYDPKALIRHLFVAKILNDTMFYTGVKSVKLLKFVFSHVRDKASRMNLWRGNKERSRRKNRGRNLSLWEELLLV